MSAPWLECVTIGDATLYLGDAYQIIPALDFVRAETAAVMDPPYEFAASGGGKFRKARPHVDRIEAKGLDKGFDIKILDVDPAGAVMAGGAADAKIATWCASAFCFFHNDQGPALWPALAARFDRTVVCDWLKTNPMPLANKNYKSDKELYIHAWDMGHHPAGALSDKSRGFKAPVGKSDFDHPTVKPYSLMRKIIVNAAPGVIVDPFMGTGSTGVAAIAANRTFIGIEIDPKWFEIACYRIQHMAEWRVPAPIGEMPGADDPATDGMQVGFELEGGA